MDLTGLSGYLQSQSNSSLLLSPQTHLQKMISNVALGAPQRSSATLQKLTRKLMNRGQKEHISIRISHPSSKAQYKRDACSHVLWDPSVYVVFWGPHEGLYLSVSTPQAPTIKEGFR